MSESTNPYIVADDSDKLVFSSHDQGFWFFVNLALITGLLHLFFPLSKSWFYEHVLGSGGYIRVCYTILAKIAEEDRTLFREASTASGKLIVVVKATACFLAVPIIMALRLAVLLSMPIGFVYVFPPLLFYTDTVHPDYNPDTSVTAFTLCWVLMCHIFESFETGINLDRLGLLMAYYGAFASATYYVQDQMLRDSVDYHGPVRLTSATILATTDNPLPSFNWTDEPIVYLNWTAEWGAGWACSAGTGNGTWCRTVRLGCWERVCFSEENCTADEWQDSTKNVEDCAAEATANWTALLNNSVSSLGFDRNLPPWEDPGWPTITGYVNCRTCEFVDGADDAQWRLNQLSYAGLPTIIVGWALAVGVTVRQKLCHSETSVHAVNHEEENELQMVEVAVPGSGVA